MHFVLDLNEGYDIYIEGRAILNRLRATFDCQRAILGSLRAIPNVNRFIL